MSRFLDEARTLARFEHRNVVRVRDFLLALPGAAAVAVALLGWQQAAGWLRWRALGWRSLRPRMKYGSALTGWFRRKRRRKWCKAAEQGDAPTGEDP